MPHTQIQTLSLRARAGLVARLSTALVDAFSRQRDRQRLAKLDEHLLRDIGLDPQVARKECAKPFWQP